MQAIDESTGAADRLIPRPALLDVATDAAAAIIRDRASHARSLLWELKGHSDFVSEVDASAEHAIRDAIHARIPDAEVIGEELSPGAIARGVTFVVDPFDGTTNFLHGYPVYAISIAAARDGIVEAGAVLDVPRCERYTALLDGDAWRNGERVQVSKLSLAPWDIAAGVLLVREAGGVVSDLDGRDATGMVHGPIVAGSPAMHARLLETITSA